MKRLAPVASENPDNPMTWDEWEQLTGEPIDYSSFYEILELNEDFTREELDRAYKKARVKYHPDKVGGDKEKFELSTEAYLRFKDMLWYKNLTQR